MTAEECKKELAMIREAVQMVKTAYPNRLSRWESTMEFLFSEIDRRDSLLRSAFGYVKAHESEGLTKALLIDIREALGEA